MQRYLLIAAAVAVIAAGTLTRDLVDLCLVDSRPLADPMTRHLLRHPCSDSRVPRSRLRDRVPRERWRRIAHAAAPAPTPNLAVSPAVGLSHHLPGRAGLTGPTTLQMCAAREILLLMDNRGARAHASQTHPLGRLDRIWGCHTKKVS
mmetsp:Transcript_42463/g.84037  ORF Transcript_42463/g.84037 Transcript_42463/m.84037 type:complete len:148 (-) Transcript_42463:236-679(-)